MQRRFEFGLPSQATFNRVYGIRVCGNRLKAALRVLAGYALQVSPRMELAPLSVCI